MFISDMYVSPNHKFLSPPSSLLLLRQALPSGMACPCRWSLQGRVGKDECLRQGGFQKLPLCHLSLYVSLSLGKKNHTRITAKDHKSQPPFILGLTNKVLTSKSRVVVRALFLFPKECVRYLSVWSITPL